MVLDVENWREYPQVNAGRCVFVAFTGGNRYNKTIVSRIGREPKTLVSEAGVCFESEVGDFDGQEGVFKRIKMPGRPSRSWETWENRAWYPSAKGEKPFQLRDSAFCDGDSGKAFLALPSLVSQIWSEIKDGDLIFMNAVVHNLFVLKEPMINALEGVHCVRLDNEQKTFEIKVVAIMTEGVGSLLQLKGTSKEVKSGDRIALFDGGGDTLNLSFFNGYKLDGQTASELGLGANFIVGEMQTGAHGVSQALKRNPYNADESLSLFVKRPKDMDKETHDAIVRSLLVCWLKEVKKVVLEKHARRIANANRIMFTGGLTLSSQFTAAMKEAGFYENCEVIKNGQIVDTQGIFARLVQKLGLSDRELGKKEVA